jgi:hypothetical protein
MYFVNRPDEWSDDGGGDADGEAQRLEALAKTRAMHFWRTRRLARLWCRWWSRFLERRTATTVARLRAVPSPRTSSNAYPEPTVRFRSSMTRRPTTLVADASQKKRRGLPDPMSMTRSEFLTWASREDVRKSKRRSDPAEAVSEAASLFDDTLVRRRERKVVDVLANAAEQLHRARRSGDVERYCDAALALSGTCIKLAESVGAAAALRAHRRSGQ